jgi:hypothetical protein
MIAAGSQDRGPAHKKGALMTRRSPWFAVTVLCAPLAVSTLNSAECGIVDVLHA